MRVFALLSIFLAQDLFAAQARTLYLTEKKTEQVRVGTNRSTILSFPVRPSKVILGNQGSFSVEYIESDLAISLLKVPAHTNLFVYLEGRRFGFDLKGVDGIGDEIVLVRDADERKVKVRFKSE